MAKILLIIFIANAKSTCTPEEKYADKCQTVCEQDGDKKGVVVDGECGCWNPRDIGKVPMKLNFRGKAPKEEPTPNIYILGG